jgi:hypothetical protein
MRIIYFGVEAKEGQVFSLLVLGIKLGLCMPDKCSTSKLHPNPRKILKAKMRRITLREFIRSTNS